MTYDRNKIQPQAIEMEEIVLGTILTYPESINDIIGSLEPAMFYKLTNQIIYESCVSIFKKINKVDLFTVTEDLRNNNNVEKAGGLIYITGLMSRVSSSEMIEHYALIIKQKYIQREYIRISNELQTRAFDDCYDVAELAEYAEMELLKISGSIHKKEPTLLGKLIDGVITVIEKIINREISLTGLPSGFTKMDRVTGGFKSKELIIIAGRPGMGKTALALQLAKNIAEFNHAVGFFSLEMSDESLARRYLSNVSGKSNVELLNGKCSLDQLLSTSEQLLKLGIYIDDTSSISIVELRAKVRKLIMQHQVKAIIVDYLQLMKGEGQSREQEVSSVSRGLKSIAKDMDIVVIALSQINRESEARKDKRPQLSDLRESGAIEQDADMVFLLYRPAYYKIESVVSDGINLNTEGLLIVDIAKNRNGATGEFNLKTNVSVTEIIQETEPF